MKEKKELTKDEYTKRIKRCEKLGARKFTKVVKKVEEIKFKIAKRIFPNYVTRINKLYDKREKQLLGRCKTEEQMKKVKEQIRIQKMLNKREENYEMNRNYHLFRNRYSELLNYLNYNKDVHKKGMIFDSITLPILTGLSFVNPVFIPFAVLDATALFINFQCVNLQNYNISRIERNKERFLRKEQQTIQKTQKNYSKGVKLINQVVEKKDETSNIDEIINNSSLEALYNMKEMARLEAERRAKERRLKENSIKTRSNTQPKAKKLGGI